MREPGAARYAVVPPYPARWLLTQLATGRPVTKASARAHAKELAKGGTPEGRLLAGQVVGAWNQLEAAAMDGEPDAPSVLRTVPRPRPVAARLEQEPPEGGGAA